MSKKIALVPPPDDQGTQPEPDDGNPFLLDVDEDSDDGDGKPQRRTYDPREFRWPASDEKGNSKKLWVRVPPLVDHQISVIIASRKFPYTFDSDFLRHAIIRHIGWLLRMETGIQSYIQHLETLGLALGHEEEQQKFAEFADRVDGIIGNLVADGGEGRREALKFLNGVLNQLNAMEDGYWRDRTRERIMRKHGGLLELSPEEIGDVELTNDES